MTTQLLTHSRQACFKTCRRQHWYSYELGIRRTTDARALRMGNAYHKGVEQLGKGRGLAAACGAVRECYFFSPDNHDEYDWAIERETVIRLICGYEWRWLGDEVKDIKAEMPFELELVNPSTNKPSRTFSVAGKIDGIIELSDGRLAVKESKLLGDDIGPESDLWPRLRIDPQISLYVTAARRLGYKVDCVYYDVCRKPTIRPTAIPLLDGDGLKIVVDGNGDRVRNAGKKPTKKCEACAGNGVVADSPCPCTLGAWRQTADTERGYVVQSRVMTPDEWGEKLAADIAERPDFYFVRKEIARLDVDLAEYEAELWDIGLTIREAQKSGRWYRTASKNTCDFCSYFSLCTSGIDAEKGALPDGFVRVEDVHPELERKKENGYCTATAVETVTAAPADIRTADLAAESAKHDFVSYF